MIQGHTNSRRLNNDLHALVSLVTEIKFWLSSCIPWFTFQYILGKLLCGTPLGTCQWGKTQSTPKGQAENSIPITVLFQYPLGLGWDWLQVPSHCLMSKKASPERDVLTYWNLVKVLSVTDGSRAFIQSINWRFQRFSINNRSGRSKNIFLVINVQIFCILNCNIYHIIKALHKYNFTELCAEQAGNLWQRSRGHSPQTDHPRSKLQEEKLQLRNSSLSYHAASKKPQRCWVVWAALAVPDSWWVMAYKREH